MPDIRFRSDLPPYDIAVALAKICREDRDGNVIPPEKGVPFLSEVDPSWYELSRSNVHKLFMKPNGDLYFSTRYSSPAIHARARAVLDRLGCKCFP